LPINKETNSGNEDNSLYNSKNIKSEQIFKLYFLFYHCFFSSGFIIFIICTMNSAVIVSDKFQSNLRSAFADIQTQRKMNDNKNKKLNFLALEFFFILDAFFQILIFYFFFV